MVSGGPARRAVRAAERPLPVKLLAPALLLLAVAASVCLRPLDRADASAAPASQVRAAQASSADRTDEAGAPGDDGERRCSKQKSTESQAAPNVAHEAPSTPLSATIAPPPVPAAEPVRDETGPSPPGPGHILLSILRI